LRGKQSKPIITTALHTTYYTQHSHSARQCLAEVDPLEDPWGGEIRLKCAAGAAERHTNTTGDSVSTLYTAISTADDDDHKLCLTEVVEVDPLGEPKGGEIRLKCKCTAGIRPSSATQDIGDHFSTLHSTQHGSA